MAGTQLTPEKITSPIQLMAAWFAMLVLIVSVLLTGAANIAKPEWAAGYLVIFASVVVVIVIGCVTLMLTKFRPHLQEGKEYAQWLKDKNIYSAGYLVKSETRVAVEKQKRVASPRSRVSSDPNKDFLISAVNAPGAVELVESLKNSGFNAELYAEEEPVDDTKKNEGIWVGSRVDPRAAIGAIKIAVNQWPNLKYIHLSGDGPEPPDYVHDQLFFGGASSAAQRWGLKKWSPRDLLELNESMSSDEFHSAIRKRYS